MNTPKLRFKEFNGDWTSEKLKNLTEVLKCGVASTPKYVTEGGYPFLSAQNVSRDGEMNYSKVNNISVDFYKKISKTKLMKGDILYSRVGASYGVAAIFDREEEYGVYVSLTHIRANQKLDNIFLKQFLNSPKARIQAEQGVFQGGGVQNLNVGVVEEFNLAIPSKIEQTKIASFLSGVDEKISQLSQKLHLLDQYKQAMMQKLFSQQLRFKADDGSEFEEWQKIKADQLFENYSNKKHDGSLTILAATQDKGIVPRDEIDIDIKSSDASVLSYKIIEKGNFVISLRSFQGGIEYSDYHGICSPAYTVLRPQKPIASSFYKNYLKTNDFIQRLSATVIGIRDGKQISYQAFATLEIDYPSIEEQTKIASFLSTIDQKIDVVSKQLEQAQLWKKGLLQQMFV